MNFSRLLLQRDALLRQARLADLAFAHERLADYARRIERARLRGSVALLPADPAAERFWPCLSAAHAAPAVLDEHFLDEDVAELEEILRFLQAEGIEVGLEFDFAAVAGLLLPIVRRELTRAGVTPPASAGAASDATSGPAALH